MLINMTTFAARKEHYIDRTMASLFASDWRDSNITINLIMGSEDQSHIQKYVDNPSIRIVPWNMETNPSLRQNCTLNKIHALRHGDDEEVLICEDDVMFKPNWLSRLRATADELAGHNYILTLYGPLSGIHRAHLIKGKTLARRYPQFVLQGAQGLFYPNKALRLELADYLKENIDKGCGDHLIGRYARTYHDLYATLDNLLWHAGAISCFH